MDVRKKVVVAVALMSDYICKLSNLWGEETEEETDSEDDADEWNIIGRISQKMNPRKRTIPRLENYVELVIPEYTPEEFQAYFRITRQAFTHLLDLIEPILRNRFNCGRPRKEIEKKLLAVIWLLATPDSYRSVGSSFNLGKSSLSDWFFITIKALNEIAPQQIRWPNFEDQHTISESFSRFAGLENVIGAIDGSYIPIKAPEKDSEVYITRKCNYAFTLQVVAKSDLSFTDAFIAYPGSVTDHRIFINSYIHKNITGNPEVYINNESYIIGDKAYPVYEWCIPPYFNRGHLTPTQNYFNIAHAKTRQVVERSFALFFGRFRRFKYLDMSRTDLIPATVLAGCVLHNIAINDLLIEDYIREGEQFIRDVENDEVYIHHQIRNAANHGYMKRQYSSTIIHTQKSSVIK